jgi:LuxR family transcriptional regulator, quorum-sensing system regulator BjaR1
MNEALTLTFESSGWDCCAETGCQEVFQSELRRTGFRDFILCAFRANEGPLRGSNILLTNVHDNVIRPVISLFDFRLSSLARRAGQQFEPFHWHIDASNDIQTDGQTTNLSGYCLPMKSGMGQSGYLVIFNGKAVERPDFSRLIFASLDLFTLQARGMGTGNQTAVGLTIRELDCLRWTAEGKTSSEISSIIKLSEHTVNHYLIAAARKLDCVNRVQAVAKALRLGLFH